MSDQALAEIVALFAGAVAAGAAAFRQITNYFINRSQARDKKAHIEGLKRISSIYDELNQIIASDSNVSRVMVLRSSNSGSIPQPGCRIFIRVLHEAYRSLTDSIIHSHLWDERQADQHYITLVRELAQDEEVRIEASELPEEAALKALYDACGTSHSEMFQLRLTGTEMLYLSVNYRHDTEPPALAKAILDNSLSNLKTLFA